MRKKRENRAEKWRVRGEKKGENRGEREKKEGIEKRKKGMFEGWILETAVNILKNDRVSYISK